MVPTIEVISPHGVQTVDLDKDVVRVGSSPNSGIVVDDVPNHCFTIRRADKCVMVTNRLPTIVKLGGKPLKPNGSEKWKPGTVLPVTPHVSLRLGKAAKPVVKKQKAKQTPFVRSNAVNRSWLFAAIAAGLLSWWIGTKLTIANSDFDSRQQEVLQLLHAKQADNSAKNKDAIQRIHRYVQIAGLERKRENMPDAKQYYRLAEDYALTTFASDEEKEDFRKVLSFLENARLD